MQHIKVNLPRTQADLISGNGEGCWVLVTNEIKAQHDANYRDGIFEGILDNDSWYYPDLKSGATIRFTMRGENRPVALFENCLEHYQVINDDAFQALLEKMRSHQNSDNK